MPHLTRSPLHCCLQRPDISRLPEVDGDQPKRSRFKAHPLGYFHSALAEVHTAEGRLYLLVAIDCRTKFAFAELHEKATRRVGSDIHHHLIEAVPCKVHTVLTENGTPLRHARQHRFGRFSHQGGDRSWRDLPSPQLRACLGPHRFRPSADQTAPPLDHG